MVQIQIKTKLRYVNIFLDIVRKITAAICQKKYAKKQSRTFLTLSTSEILIKFRTWPRIREQNLWGVFHAKQDYQISEIDGVNVIRVIFLKFTKIHGKGKRKLWNKRVYDWQNAHIEEVSKIICFRIYSNYFIDYEHIREFLKYHPFSTYAKVSEKPTFLTPNSTPKCAYHGVRNVSFP